MSKKSSAQLCPEQQRTFDSLSAGLQIGSILRLWGGVGRGKTTILRELHTRLGGAFVSMKDFVEASAKNHPLALEETLYKLVLEALKSHSAVIIDDVHLLDLSSSGCSLSALGILQFAHDGPLLRRARGQQETHLQHHEPFG
jgi:predicted ATPase